MRAHSLELTTAEAASGRLGISRASLYAYVSRGLIRSFTSPHDPRQRLYALDDVEALVERKARFRRPAAAAATALDWGLPVLETGLTQIKDGQLLYRGRGALAVAGSATLEDAASLLIGDLPDRAAKAAPPPAGAASALGPQAFVARAIRLLSEPADEAADLAAESLAILRLMAAAGSGADPGSVPIHAHLTSAWNAPPEAGEAIRRALVLCADHELSASAFAVRVAASTGASLRHAVVAGLAALGGPRHGGATEQVRAFLEERENSGGDPPERGPLPGFHHPLYPEGDPRGTALLQGVPLRPSDAAILDEIADAAGGTPTIDAALVMTERGFGLPRGAAFALFAIGRTAGWLAHAMEQRSQGSLIRPRARYHVAEEAPEPAIPTP
ncbi:citrate/2-methylcitrate synthase [Microvirga sp. GCM10011540]|uniref:citrate/2-methylcitrate synthase n=1 Tax=Microvirga sp. GCM10011540 TaxID=3317338 RepID=UPI0036073BE9